MSFFDEDAIVGINNPRDYRHMKLLRLALRIISSWPGKELGESMQRFEGKGHAYYNTILSIVYLILGVWYLKAHINALSFYELGHMYIILLMNMLSTSRAFTLCLSTKYKNVALLFLLKMHLFYHKDKSQYATKIHIKVHTFSKFFSAYLMTMMVIALCLFLLTPVYNNYSSGKFKSKETLHNSSTPYEHAAYFMLPFNTDTNLNGYIAATAFIWYGGYLLASSVCVFDLFLSLMVFNLWGHFKILLHMLETFPRPASVENANIYSNANHIVGSEKYSESEEIIISAKLKDCIDYHDLIVDFTNKMSEAFGMALFLYYMFHQVSGCLLLLECSQMNPQALARYVPLTLIMFQQLIQLSVIFESIGTMSEKLKDAVYELPWEHMKNNNRRTVLTFLINVQEPIHVKAGGLVNVGVTTMASIIKTSFSYFAFLRTVSD